MIKDSILGYPDRGPWGESQYRADLRQLDQITWRELVRTAVETHQGQVSLHDLCRTLGGNERAVNNSH